MSSLINTQNGNPLNVSQRLLDSNVSIIKQMMYLAEEEIKKGKSIVSLGVGIPYYKMPEVIRTKVANTLLHQDTIDKYTFFAGIPQLRQLIAEQESEKLKIPVDESNILITPGSMAALLYSILALVGEGDEVILLSPYFASYAEQVSLAGGKSVEVPLIEPTNKNDVFHLDLEKIKSSITPRTKVIIVNSPNNPTGAVYLKNELLELAEIIKEHSIYLITDEVYEYLVYEETECFNMATIKELWPKVIRCCSFSKKYGMTGWRGGFLHSNSDLIKMLLTIHDNTIVCAPHITQMTIYHALTTEIPELEEHKEQLKKNRNEVCKRLDGLSNLFSYSTPQGAYYIFPKFNHELSSVELAKKILYETGVVTIPGSGFGKVGEKHLRLSFGGKLEEITEAFNRIEKWYRSSY